MPQSNHEVANNETKNRFEVLIDDHVAELTYIKRDDKIVFTHTGVPSELGGQGLGSQLVKAGLEYAKANNLKVVPRCPFVRSYIDRHPEYESLVG